MTTNLDPPHPLLTEPVIYVINPPKQVQWKHLKATFSVCGPATTTGKNAILGSGNRKKWTIRFHCMLHAEMALATLRGAPISDVDPPCTMVLSHSPTGESALPDPSSRIFPQYLKADPEFFQDSKITLQLLFKWFRTAGPIVSIRTDVGVGKEEHRIVIEYWKEEHARLAHTKRNDLHKQLRKRSAFYLRTYDPYSLHCSGFGPGFSHQKLMSLFSQYGKIVSATLNNAGKANAYWLVTLSSRFHANAALRELNGKVVGIGRLIVRYDEPDAQHIFHPSSASDIPTRGDANGTTGSGADWTHHPRLPSRAFSMAILQNRKVGKETFLDKRMMAKPSLPPERPLQGRPLRRRSNNSRIFNVAETKLTVPTSRRRRISKPPGLTGTS
ncbi:hypothetical protein BDY19DRAFT_178352 [Irpex rosettiformis]|uniref:Uncharacterized protein n=1 Tax=Irpex rosettiformis TaxID=378272 RepID=A0ACB8U3C7_9APHY|nr:hypothetical protein BDY19DRAFT_178352 [Irpex rosettiformis]